VGKREGGSPPWREGDQLSSNSTHQERDPSSAFLPRGERKGKGPFSGGERASAPRFILEGEGGGRILYYQGGGRFISLYGNSEWVVMGRGGKILSERKGEVGFYRGTKGGPYQPREKGKSLLSKEEAALRLGEISRELSRKGGERIHSRKTPPSPRSQRGGRGRRGFGKKEGGVRRGAPGEDFQGEAEEALLSRRKSSLF